MPKYLTKCDECGRTTSRSYARAHDGKCKLCADGESGAGAHRCPDCGGPISTYRLAHGYHCDGCTRAADPMGWANEVRGLCDYRD